MQAKRVFDQTSKDCQLVSSRSRTAISRTYPLTGPAAECARPIAAERTSKCVRLVWRAFKQRECKLAKLFAAKFVVVKRVDRRVRLVFCRKLNERIAAKHRDAFDVAVRLANFLHLLLRALIRIEIADKDATSENGFCRCIASSQVKKKLHAVLCYE